MLLPLSNLVCEIHGSRETIEAAAIRMRDVPSARGWVCGADGVQRRPEVLHREGRQGLVAAEISHML